MFENCVIFILMIQTTENILFQNYEEETLKTNYSRDIVWKTPTFRENERKMEDWQWKEI